MKKQYQSLTDFAAEIERRESVKQDFVVNTKSIGMDPDGQRICFGGQDFRANEHFHGQLAAKLAIPKQYYDRIQDIPGLRAQNVNALLNQTDEKRLVRTLDTTARAFLSDRYKPIDNFFILSAMLPALKGSGKEVQVASSNITDRNMFLEILFPGLSGLTPDGKKILYGVALRNSEVGAGIYDLSELTWIEWCANGARHESLINRKHVGRRIGNDDADYHIYSDDTIMAELKAYELRIRDILKNAITEVNFKALVDKYHRAAGDVVAKPVQIIENVTKRFEGLLNKSDAEVLLGNMEKEKGFNRYGLANAITFLAHEIDDADRAYDLQGLGGKIIDLKPEEWSVLAA